MTRITSMKELREKLLKAIEDFEDCKIDSIHLTTLSKACEAIVSGLKSEMQYAILTNSEPNIPFFGELDRKGIMHKLPKKLL